MSSKNTRKLMKILCLHGYRQSGDIFKQKLGSLRKGLKRHAELVFITAPNQLPKTDGSSESSEEASINEQYAWWFSTEEMTFDSKKPSDVCIGFQKSLELVEKIYEEQGPFDGLLGFSQGASFIGVLCGMQELNMLDFDIGFVILVGGFKSLCLPHLNFYCKVSSVPSLHVYGETDEIISKERSELLQDYFEHCEVIIHPGKHYVPATKKEIPGYVSFLEDRFREMEISEERQKKQIQIGSYVLEQVEDSGSNKSSDEECVEIGDNSDNSEEQSSRTKANKGGITKQRRKQLAQISEDNK